MNIELPAVAEELVVLKDFQPIVAAYELLNKSFNKKLSKNKSMLLTTNGFEFKVVVFKDKVKVHRTGISFSATNQQNEVVEDIVATTILRRQVDTHTHLIAHKEPQSLFFTKKTLKELNETIKRIQSLLGEKIVIKQKNRIDEGVITSGSFSINHNGKFLLDKIQVFVSYKFLGCHMQKGYPISSLPRK